MSNKIEILTINEIDARIDKFSFVANFVYNYFEKTEREFIVDKYKKNLNGLPLELIPRYVRIDFSRNSAKNFQGLKNQRFKLLLDEKSLQDIVKKARSESRISSRNFLPITFQDKKTSKGFYDLSESIRKKIALTDVSLSTNANMLFEIYKAAQGVIRGNEEALVSALITNSDFNQPTTIATNNSEKASLHSGVFNKINSIKIKSKINKKYAERVVEKISNSKSSPFSDEMKDLLGVLNYAFSASSQSNRTEDVDDYLSYYKLETPAIGKDYKTEILGYIVEKYENIMSDDLDESRNNLIKHPSFFIKGTNPEPIIDRNVRYGGSYEYVVKTVVGLSQNGEINQNETKFDAKLLKVYVSEGSLGRSVYCNESIPPLPPENLTFKYNFKEDALRLMWDFPFNKQQDIKRFQIYRRSSLDMPFELLRELDFDDSTIRDDLTPSSGNKDNVRRYPGPICYFYDTGFNTESSYIYSVAAIDARGLTSGYSSQFLVSYDRFKNKTNVKFLSKQGAPKPYPNIFLDLDALPDAITESRKSKINIYFNPECKNANTYSSELSEDGKSLSLDRTDKVFLNNTEGSYRIQVINIDSQESDNITFSINDEEYISEAELIERTYLTYDSGIK